MSDGYDTPTQAEQVQDVEPIPVHIASSHATPIRPAAAEFGDCMTWPIDTFANMGRPTMILPRRYRRSKAKIFVPLLTVSTAANETSGQVTSPGANANIAQITVANLQPGQYIVHWSVGLDGTVSATDTNNFKITGPGFANGVVAEVNPVVGHYPQIDLPLTVPVGNATALSIRSIAAGTVGAIYSGTVSIVPVAGVGTGVIVNSRIEPLMQPVPIGFEIPLAPYQLEWENQHPCYAVLSPQSFGPLRVSVLDQAYQEA